ncbi:Uncharacterised protein [[Clostridium] sordellii]|uniref:hypothetical protein n=1 Tax=Paraclostridium sordellii TaxID=1505 RepID=UPI0005DFD38F|nr:hypothetical protein [Paeniclostridium sordellii]CEN23724.1 Uncharacterised protein [[Clostridium] sordellii] [Paeniclostridium sordellii]
MQDNKYKRVQAIDTDTGEVLGNTLIKDNGSEQLIMKVVKENQAKSIKKKNKNKYAIIDHIQKHEGSFVHLIYKYRKPLMDTLQVKCEGNKANIHMIRFIQLATYSTFGGKLFDNNRNRIKKSSLSNIWDTTSRNSVNETYKLLIECGYIYETEEGYIMISEDLIVKGAIEDFKKLKKDDEDQTYTRLFTNNIQAMYEGTNPKSRKQLANLFKVLPYINFKHNVFCSNPTETDPKELELYTWTDLARLCGYDEKKQIARFKKDLWTLKVYGFDTIGEFKTQSGMAICINPKIYYSGDNIEDVNRLYVMFDMVQGNK